MSIYPETEQARLEWTRNDDSSSAPAYDNFYSPWDKDFYDSKQYCDLNFSDNEIRLLEILPTGDDGVLQFNLWGSYYLSSKFARPEYEAISYCAGDPRKTLPIKVNGINFNVFANLGLGLQQIVRQREESHLMGSARMIWVDQICINQSDKAERSHQVRQMREIYNKASNVLIWLGEDESGGDSFRVLKRWHGLLVASIARDPYLTEDAMCFNIAASILDGNPLEFAHGGLENEWFQSEMKALKKLTNAPYWSRSWVCQEVVVSEEATVLFGKESMVWSEFSEAFKILRILQVRSVSKLLVNPEVLLQPQGEAIISAFWSLHSALVGNIVHAKLAWDTVAGQDLKTILEVSRPCQASDPRDKVYAFIGIVESGYGIVPDYTAEPEYVFWTTCKRIILNEMSLDVLNYCHGKKRNPLLPSWTPDWSEGAYFPLYDENRMNDGKKFCSSAGCTSAASFPLCAGGISHPAFRVQCLLLDQVANENTLWDLPDTDDSSVTVVSKMEYWATLVDIDSYNDTVGEDAVKYFNGQDFRTAFLCTMLRGESKGWPTYKSEDHSSDEYRLYLKLEEGFKRDMMNTVDGTWDFFHSPKGYIGLVHPGAQYTDKICILVGASLPFILRPYGDHYVLVGDAYVEGFMYGEAIDMMRSGELEVQTIDIY